MTNEVMLPYNGTAGYVDRPASVTRAISEAESGIASERQRVIYATVARMGTTGATWRDIQRLFPELHHGQISGALSCLHKNGVVFALRTTRRNCHPYVASVHRHLVNDHNRFDEPAKTRSQQRVEAISDAIAYLDVAMNSTEDKNALIEAALNRLAPYSS